MSVIILLLVLIGVPAFILLSKYNSLVAKQEEAKNSKRQIDIQLDRRFKVFSNLINVVKQVMDYEKTTLKDIVALRNSAVAANKSGDQKSAIEAEEKISAVARGINVLFEQYPQLKAMDNAQHLQEEIVSTENKLSFSKQGYNDSIENYNVERKSFFGSIVASMFPHLNTDMPYWEISTEKAAQLEEYQVEFK